MTITEDFCKQFADEWINAWNSHDLDRIMNHYAEELEFYSPLIIKLNINPDGRITHKTDLRDYFKIGLEKFPDLHFSLHHVLVGLNSVVLYYGSVNNTLSAEFMLFNEEGKISQVRAHYTQKSD